jgi:hypothetical protein
METICQECDALCVADVTLKLIEILKSDAPEKADIIELIDCFYIEVQGGVYVNSKSEPCLQPDSGVFNGGLHPDVSRVRLSPDS